MPGVDRYLDVVDETTGARHRVQPPKGEAPYGRKLKPACAENAKSTRYIKPLHEEDVNDVQRYQPMCEGCVKETWKKRNPGVPHPSYGVLD